MMEIELYYSKQYFQKWFQISYINNDTLKSIPISYKFLSNFKHISFMTCIMMFLINPILHNYVIIVTPYTPIIIMILELSLMQL